MILLTKKRLDYILNKLGRLEIKVDTLEWKLQKEVCYWQEACQNISEEAYEEHLEKGGSM
tara:strand:- start:767 stop:946 length:180 start_codon:yes stop_codon:yes gene_type:complete